MSGELGGGGVVVVVGQQKSISVTSEGSTFTFATRQSLFCLNGSDNKQTRLSLAGVVTLNPC